MPTIRGLTSHNAPYDIDFSRMRICSSCFEIHGPWQDINLRVQGELEWPYQGCACEQKLLMQDERKWPGFDFNTVVELCKCCGAELLNSGSRWSVWFCDVCKQRVRILHGKYQRYIVPVGRHSMMGGFGLSGEALHQKAEREYFVIRWRSISESIDDLYRFGKLVVSENLKLLGLSQSHDVGLVDYLGALNESPIDKEAVFVRLCQFFEIEA